MTRAILLCAAAATALSLGACSKKDAANTEAAATPAVSAAQDATSAAVGAVSASTMGANDTDAFVSNASQSDMYEVQAGKLAQTKGQSAGVKDFGKMMVTMHTAMMNEMKPLVMAAGKAPAAALDERRQGLIDNLTAAKPADFDKEYLAQQEAAHEEALTLMKGYADHGDDAGLKAGAAKAVPSVQTHLDKVKALRTAMK